MKISLDWLREWAELPDSVAELEERLTLSGTEIEAILRSGPDLSDVIVGAVLERKQHPNADRLSLCSVEVGQGEPLDIVCGAANVAAGQKVAVALHGAVLPGDFKIKRSKIRGVVSNGMICSVRELGLGDEHEGIWVLPADAPVGAKLPDVIPAGDVVFDVEITPNRGDQVSMLGMAREVRALFGGELRLPPLACEESGAPASEVIRIGIDDGGGCHRYVGRVIRGVRVGPSPEWLQKRLETAGLRSINNVVDVTNLVMLELGQPLHAFDLARLRGGVVRVRSASPDEKIVTLDGQTRQLASEDLVIADAEGAIAVAGVMGGAESEVSADTRDVLLEAAHFHPSRIRRTARRLGLPSDASYRFERGVDRAGVERAADRAARLLAEIAGGEVAPGQVVAEGEPPPPIPTIELDPARLNRLLGTALDADAMAALLERLEIAVLERSAGRLRCRPPSHRNDLAIPEDLIEEVARIHGYDRIEATLPEGACAGTEEPPLHAFADRTRDALVAAGLVELITFSAFAPEDLDRLRLAEGDARRRTLGIVNPIQAGAPLLRTTLVPSLLRATQLNLARQADAVLAFEVGRRFLANAPGELPEERLEAVAVLAGEAGAALWRQQAPLFFRAKGVAEHLLAVLGREARFRAGSDEPYLHPAISGSWQAGGRAVLHVGELHPETAAAFGIEAPVALLLADLETLAALPESQRRHRPISKHPRVRRDLAVLVPRETPAGDMLEAIRQGAGAALQDVVLFDRYEGEGVPEGQVSLAFRLDFQHEERTLTDAEVTKATDKVVRMLAKRFGGELR